MVWAFLSACMPRWEPVSAEVCDGVDNDGDGLVDDDDPSLDPESGTWAFVDADQDGFGARSEKNERRCRPGDRSTNADDCDEADAAIHPGAVEICDDKDNDCDGLEDQLDPGCVLADMRYTYRDEDQDGFGGAPFFACGTGG